MTPQTQFTPGPWKWVGTQGNPELFAYLGNPNHEHDYVFVNLSGFKPTPENARLIAAAPSLYAALQAMLGICELAKLDQPGTIGAACMNDARKALDLGSSTPR